jgi:hypothetical protein
MLPRVIVDNLKIPMIHLLTVEGCLVHILVAHTLRFLHMLRVVWFLSTSYEPCVLFRVGWLRALQSLGGDIWY